MCVHQLDGICPPDWDNGDIIFFTENFDNRDELKGPASLATILDNPNRITNNFCCSAEAVNFYEKPFCLLPTGNNQCPPGYEAASIVYDKDSIGNPFQFEFEGTVPYFIDSTTTELFFCCSNNNRTLFPPQGENLCFPRLTVNEPCPLSFQEGILSIPLDSEPLGSGSRPAILSDASSHRITLSFCCGNVSCDPPCVNGFCSFGSECICDDGWFGNDCSEQEGKDNNGMTVILLSTIIPISICLICGILLVVLIFIKRRKKERKQSEIMAVPLGGYSGRSTNNEFMSSQEYGQIYLKNIEIIEEIGKGAFGSVFKGIWEKTTTVALKTFIDKEAITSFRAEAAMLMNLRHPNIVQYLGMCVNQGNEYIVMEYLSNGSLLQNLRTRTFTGSQLMRMLIEVSSGMTILAENNIIHRDLAARNIFISEHDTAKVGDFGMSKLIGNDSAFYKSEGIRAAIRWSAPEAVQYSTFSVASDVWSFAVLAWEVFELGKVPYFDMSNREVIQEIEKGYMLPIPTFCPASLYSLLQRCWSRDPQDRPTFIQIYTELNEISKNEKQLLQHTLTRAPHSPGMSHDAFYQ